MNRPQFDGFSETETAAILDYVCGDIVDIHINSTIAHGPLFLQWHREYLEGLEEHLLNVGMDHLVPLPAWAPCSAIPVSGPFVPGPLETCPEQDPVSEEFEGRTIDCGEFASDRYTCESLCEFVSFTEFQNTLQHDHNGIHNALGETTFNSSASPAVVLFWPWHAYVDDIYLKYQAATMAADLPIELELYEQNCCNVIFRSPKFCCSEVVWAFNDDEAGFDYSWSDDQFYYMSATIDTWPKYDVSISYTGTCGATRIVEQTFPSPDVTPNLPNTPPLHMQYICMEDFQDENCYDFGDTNCLETLEVTTSSNKLIAQVDGTELCLYYIHPAPYTGTVTITPIGTCSDGNSVTWTIYANQPRVCGGFDNTGFRSMTSQRSKKVNVYPNPFTEELNITYGDSGDGQEHTFELLDMLGRVVKRNITKDQSKLQTADLEAGIYVLRVINTQNEVLHLEKYVKQ